MEIKINILTADEAWKHLLSEVVPCPECKNIVNGYIVDGIIPLWETL